MGVMLSWAERADGRVGAESGGSPAGVVFVAHPARIFPIQSDSCDGAWERSGWRPNAPAARAARLWPSEATSR